jgi:toxin ParE1/3/4
VKRSVEWSQAALDDLKEQISFIALDNPMAARHVAQVLRLIAANLGEFATGRPGRVKGSYEKPVSGLPYVIAYRVKLVGAGERVFILRVIHTSRDWPEQKWPA